MANDWLLFGAPLASAAVAGGVAILSSKLTMTAERERATEERIEGARLESERWSRDRRGDSYKRLMMMHGRLLLEASAAADSPPSDPGAIAQYEAALTGLMDAIAEVQVFGSRDVSRLSDELGKLISLTKLPVDQSAVSPAWEKLIAAVRNDLGVPD